MTASDQISDRFEILDLMNRYALAVDRRDWDLYRSVFAPDARIDYRDSGGEVGALEPIVEWLSAVLAPFAGLQHNMGNHLVEFDADGDTARACTYFLAVHTSLDGRGEEVLLRVGGFYQDRLVRRDPGWRIAERVELSTWMDGPYPEDIPRPPWYGKTTRNLPSIPG